MSACYLGRILTNQKVPHHAFLNGKPRLHSIQNVYRGIFVSLVPVGLSKHSLKCTHHLHHLCAQLVDYAVVLQLGPAKCQNCCSFFRLKTRRSSSANYWERCSVLLWSVEFLCLSMEVSSSHESATGGSVLYCCTVVGAISERQWSAKLQVHGE